MFAVPVTLDGYGATTTLASGTLTAVASGLAGKGALGAAQRAIPVEDITALEFHAATALRNGNIVIQSTVGKTVLYFRRKQADAAERLYEALRVTTGAAADTAVTAGFANESSAAMMAARTAALEAAKQQAREQFEASRIEMRAAAKEFWAELRVAWSEETLTASEVAQLQAFLDEAEAPDPLDVGDEIADLALPITGDVNDVETAEGDDARDEQAATEEAQSEQLKLAKLTNALLDKAEFAAKAGDISLEERQIRLARALARRQGRRGDRKSLEAAIDGRIQEGTLRRSASRLGTITSETSFTRWNRTGSMGAGSRGEKRIEVWSDRIVTDTAAYPITAQTGAQVYLDGQVIVTQRPTLTRMVLFAPLPGSALIPGLAFQKNETKDNRSAEVQIRGINWALRAALHPDVLSAPRQLAEQINAIASSAAASQTPSTTASDLLTQLERLSFLVANGTISPAEAQAIKTSLMQR